MLGFQIQYLGRCGTVTPRKLSANPQLCALIGNLHGAVQRFHGRMSQVGKYELCLQLMLGCSKRCHVGVKVDQARLTR
ncbi:hypothetical protein D3C81_1972620 [compost metagenome]